LRSLGVTESFRAVEVQGEERDRAITAYRASVGNMVDSAFARLPDAADNATFRLDDPAVVSVHKDS
jgi:hypothetical protein